jgi:hypothetical protein
LLCLLLPAVSSAEFRVGLCDTTGVELSTLQAAREEASALFETTAVFLRWEADCDQPPRTSAHSARVYVVPRIPEGIANRHRQYRDKTNVMGYVLANEGEKRAGVIYVARGAVEAIASRSGRTAVTEAQLARALGRVFAHELAHRFLASGHTRRGILKESLSQEELIGGDGSALFFTPQQVQVLRLRVEHSVP